MKSCQGRVLRQRQQGLGGREAQRRGLVPGQWAGARSGGRRSLTAGAGRGSAEPGLRTGALPLWPLFRPRKGWTASLPSVDLGTRAPGVKAPAPSSVPESSRPGPAPCSSLLPSSLRGRPPAPPSALLVRQEGHTVAARVASTTAESRGHPLLPAMLREGRRRQTMLRISPGFPRGGATPTPNRLPGWGLDRPAALRECPIWGGGGRQSFPLGDPRPHLALEEISQEH